MECGCQQAVRPKGLAYHLSDPGGVELPLLKKCQNQWAAVSVRGPLDRQAPNGVDPTPVSWGSEVIARQICPLSQRVSRTVLEHS